MRNAGAEAAEWAARLEAIADATLGPLAAGGQVPSSGREILGIARGFRDEMGHSRAIDVPVILHSHGVSVGGADDLPGEGFARYSDVAWSEVRAEAMRAAGRGEAESPDLALWWGLVDRSLAIDGAVRGEMSVEERVGAPAVRQPSISERAGAWGAIEVWTETELRGVHALWWHAWRGGDTCVWRKRVEESRMWLIEHIQPDNATNRPWCAHVFLIGGIELGVGDRGHESRMFGETLIHNCQVSLGRADALSAWILRDSARALRVWDAARGTG